MILIASFSHNFSKMASIFFLSHGQSFRLENALDSCSALTPDALMSSYYVWADSPGLFRRDFQKQWDHQYFSPRLTHNHSLNDEVEACWADERKRRWGRGFWVSHFDNYADLPIWRLCWYTSVSIALPRISLVWYYISRFGQLDSISYLCCHCI